MEGGGADRAYSCYTLVMFERGMGVIIVSDHLKRFEGIIFLGKIIFRMVGTIPTQLPLSPQHQPFVEMSMTIWYASIVCFYLDSCYSFKNWLELDGICSQPMKCLRC